jgi:DNA-binding transcriptional LysR family regulator
MTPLLDLALLKTLVEISRSASLAQAAQKIGRTQSAVSMQMQKLEDMLSVPLFDRSGRSLALTDAGLAMLGYAQRMLELNGDAIAAVSGHQVAGQVSLGMSVDFEHTWLPKTMARFAKTHPRIQVDVRLARNTALEMAVADGELDIALIFAPASPAETTLADTSLVGTVPMAWIAAPGFSPPSGANLPLLLLDSPCLFRSAALDALEKAHMPWRAAVTSPSLGGLWATALAGMGVIVRSSILIPPGLIDVGARFGLPPLPDVAVRILESDASETAPRATLHTALSELANEVVQPPRR